MTDSINESSNESPIERACRIVGSAAELARRCRVSPQAVDKWKSRVPPERVRDIVRATQGAVAAHELRPDFYPAGFEFPIEMLQEGVA